ncbi:RhoGAP domain protein [Teladorsagia circumcincta]|uniref:RhoGAP domain protein n=1 Tax=Teladorsagia circumcincta TaxID=45464 RepID=A0A2G9UVL2_TELCI|nr:RhoGAP domain protein [Teladorsagia circumcincta]
MESICGRFRQGIVKHDMMIEKRVLDDLVQFQEMEKALCKSRERLSNAFTDVDIAKKALEKADSTSSNIAQLQDTLDASQLKLENQKVFTALLEEQLEYHRVAMRTLEMVLPEIRRDIGELPACHRHNLTYLINFLSEMLQHQEQTAMNCGNLAIVFGPNLLGGDIDGNNAVGTKIVETLLKNAPRLFGCPVVSNNGHGGGGGGPNGQQNSSRNISVDTGQSLMSADLNESFGMSPTPAQESDDSFDEYQDESLPSSISRSHGEMISSMFNVPQRPPPPTFRSEGSNSRPLSYNKAVGAEPIPVPRSRPSRSVIVENSSSSSGSSSIKRPTILNREDIVGLDVSNR